MEKERERESERPTVIIKCQTCFIVAQKNDIRQKKKEVCTENTSECAAGIMCQ